MKYLILILIITLASCAGPTLLTKEGGQVRQISINEAKQCDFIEVIVTRDRGPSSGQALSDARNDLRNIIAEKGGNAFTLLDEHKDGGYVTPVEAENKFETFISRIREDKTNKNSLNLWIVSDNLLRGAALNAVEIAETLIKKNIDGK